MEVRGGGAFWTPSVGSTHSPRICSPVVSWRSTKPQRHSPAISLKYQDWFMSDTDTDTVPDRATYRMYGRFAATGDESISTCRPSFDPGTSG